MRLAVHASEYDNLEWWLLTSSLQQRRPFWWQWKVKWKIFLIWSHNGLMVTLHKVSTEGPINGTHTCIDNVWVVLELPINKRSCIHLAIQTFLEVIWPRQVINLHSEFDWFNKIHTQEEAEAEIKQLRRSLNFKATPMPSFYHGTLLQSTDGKKVLCSLYYYYYFLFFLVGVGGWSFRRLLGPALIWEDENHILCNI